MNQPTSPDVISFESQPVFETWLANNFERTEGIWLRFYKKKSATPSITYDEAVNTALCFGWIDGQKQAYDEVSYLIRFTPRRKRSVWSKVNTEKVEQLIKT